MVGQSKPSLFVNFVSKIYEFIFSYIFYMVFISKVDQHHFPRTRASMLVFPLYTGCRSEGKGCAHFALEWARGVTLHFHALVSSLRRAVLEWQEAQRRLHRGPECQFGLSSSTFLVLLLHCWVSWDLIVFLYKIKGGTWWPSSSIRRLSGNGSPESCLPVPFCLNPRCIISSPVVSTF